MPSKAGRARGWWGFAAMGAAAATVVSGGCKTRTGGAGGEAAPVLSEREVIEGQAALLPARLVIHPLTRMGVDAQGRPAVILHLELRDQFDQNTRALGLLEVALQRPGLDLISTGAGGGEGATGDATWRIDLRDPDRNARLFDDLVTRTYTITLTDVPPWLAAWAGERGDGPGIGMGAPTVLANFTFADPRRPTGPGRVLSDTARLGR